MAEERGQVELREEGEDENEEAKYSAVDTLNQNQTAIGGLDGIISTNKTAPKGKFKAFHKKIDKKAMDAMTSTFLENLSKKSNKDALLAPGSQQGTQSVQAHQAKAQAAMSMQMQVGAGPGPGHFTQ